MNTDNLLLNPQLYGEAASHNYIEIDTPVFQWRFEADLIGYKYEGVDAQFLWDLNNHNNFCYGVSWITDAFNFIADISVNVNECDFGLFGGIFQKNVSNCRWKRYNLDAPIYTFD